MSGVWGAACLDPESGPGHGLGRMASGEGDEPQGSGEAPSRATHGEVDAAAGRPADLDTPFASEPDFGVEPDDGGFDPDGALARIRAREAMEVLRARERAGPWGRAASPEGQAPGSPEALGSTYGRSDGYGEVEGLGVGPALKPSEGALEASLPPAHWTRIGHSEVGEALPVPDPAEEVLDDAGAAVAKSSPSQVDVEAARPPASAESLKPGLALPSGPDPAASAIDTVPPDEATRRPHLREDEFSAALPVDPDAPEFETVDDPRIPAGQDSFRIGEVARVVGVKPYVLRYWETEFACVEPEKTSTNQRRYSRGDVATLLRIRRLRHDAQLTVAQTRSLVEEAPEGVAGPVGALAAEALSGYGTSVTVSELVPVEARRLLDRTQTRQLRARIADMRSAVLELLEAVED